MNECATPNIDTNQREIMTFFYMLRYATRTYECLLWMHTSIMWFFYFISSFLHASTVSTFSVHALLWHWLQPCSYSTVFPVFHRFGFCSLLFAICLGGDSAGPEQAKNVFNQFTSCGYSRVRSFLITTHPTIVNKEYKDTFTCGWELWRALSGDEVVVYWCRQRRWKQISTIGTHSFANKKCMFRKIIVHKERETENGSLLVYCIVK